MTAAESSRRSDVEVKRCNDCGARFGVDAAFCPFDGVPLRMATWNPGKDPRIGQTAGGRYEIVAPLGEGGMGTVYKVRHVALNRFFAMKVLRTDLATDADLARRFAQEAKATAAIKHPSVVAISDFGELDDGLPYFVMELLVGETLSTRMRGRGLMPPAEAVRIARLIADGLEASHQAKVVHRDLKPENVFLIGDEVRIVDFGAAKIVGASKITRTGIVFGTPYYMSPEQASGAPLDARADVYSLGVLIYEMVTGRVPFDAESYMGVLSKHLFEAPPRLGVDAGGLEDIILRAMAKSPDLRWSSMAEMSRALATVSLLPRASTTADRIEQSVERIARAEEEQRRERARRIAGAVFVVCALVGIGAASVYLGAREPRPIAPAPPSPPATTAAQAEPSGRAVEIPPPPAPPEATADPPPATSPATSRPVSSAPPPPPPLIKPPPPKPPAQPATKGPEEFPDPWRKR